MQLQQVTGLAAGGGAQIQHALAGLDIEQLCRQLRARILHGNRAFIKTGQLTHIHALFQPQRLRGKLRRRGFYIMLCQQRLVLCGRVLPGIDPQPQGRAHIGGLQNGLPLPGPVLSDHVQQPLRVRIAGNIIVDGC